MALSDLFVHVYVFGVNPSDRLGVEVGAER